MRVISKRNGMNARLALHLTRNKFILTDRIIFCFFLIIFCFFLIQSIISFEDYEVIFETDFSLERSEWVRFFTKVLSGEQKSNRSVELFL